MVFSIYLSVRGGGNYGARVAWDASLQVIVTYGHDLKGREAIPIALKINGFVSCVLNSLAHPQKYIPAGRISSKSACLQDIPGIDTEVLSRRFERACPVVS